MTPRRSILPHVCIPGGHTSPRTGAARAADCRSGLLQHDWGLPQPRHENVVPLLSPTSNRRGRLLRPTADRRADDRIGDVALLRRAGVARLPGHDCDHWLTFDHSAARGASSHHVDAHPAGAHLCCRDITSHAGTRLAAHPRRQEGQSQGPAGERGPHRHEQERRRTAALGHVAHAQVRAVTPAWSSRPRKASPRSRAAV